MSMQPEDIRAEYAAIVSYHNALVTARFTVAGLLIAGSGFLASAVFKTELSFAAKTAGATLAMWLSLCVWVLELRSRALYRNIALRGVQIEHEKWSLVGSEWQDGFFSRQYKTIPGEQSPAGPSSIDIPTVFGYRLPQRLARLITHSAGFDLLYGGSAVFWLAAAAYFCGRLLAEVAV
jgi:hypothetical protein